MPRKKIARQKVAKVPTRPYEENLLERLNKYRVRGENPDDCYKWSGASTGGPRGISYGVLSDKRKTTGDKSIAAHRLAYELEIGPIPEGAYILHSCDYPPCTNPRHLRAGNASENMQDRTRRGRYRVYKGNEHWTHQYPENLSQGEEHWARKSPEWSKRQRGEGNFNSVLTETDVLKIRAEWDGTWEQSRWIASLYAVPVQTIQRIVRRRTWQHLPPQPGEYVADPERAWARGERIKNALLSVDDVLQIRKEWDAFSNKYRARAGFCRLMAERYGTQPVAIDKVLRGVNWRHV